MPIRRQSILYRRAAPNPCPGCGQSQWLVGRVMAECAFCETALPLEQNFRFTGLSLA
ncbi:MAG TPA: hypothetical protein VF509_01755 [Sphingobium sp.]